MSDRSTEVVVLYALSMALIPFGVLSFKYQVYEMAIIVSLFCVGFLTRAIKIILISKGK